MADPTLLNSEWRMANSESPAGGSSLTGGSIHVPAVGLRERRAGLSANTLVGALTHPIHERRTPVKGLFPCAFCCSERIISMRSLALSTFLVTAPCGPRAECSPQDTERSERATPQFHIFL